MKKLQTIASLILVVILFSCGKNSTTPFTHSIVPLPDSIELKEGSFTLKPTTLVVQTNEVQQKAVVAVEQLFNKVFNQEPTKGSEPSTKAINFIQKEGFTKEGYSISISSDKIEISASDEAGFFYGVQTLRQLCINKNGAKSIEIPAMNLKDAPRFSWRGMHMDFSRHFFTMDEVKEFLDEMAYYKLNSYHMHLTDDQGWRIEIKKYPELTSKGAWRDFNNQDSICMKRSKTEPYFEIAEKNIRKEDKKYGGFFTQEQLKEIVRYADERCITVVPEIDMPGHFKAAIDNYPFLTCDGETGWGAIFSVPACLGEETTYEFTKNILAEVAEIFPSEYIHIGGDEVNIASWKECKNCQNTIKKHHLKNEHELQAYFNIQIEAYLKSIGKKMLGWDEIVEGGATKDATVMWWRGWVPKTLTEAAENGNTVVIASTNGYYFDYQDGGNVVGVYNKEPIPENFPEDKIENVLGIQACLWSEWLPNQSRLQYMTYPRILAFAETAWTAKEKKNLSDFTNRLDAHFDRLDAEGIVYELPAVEGIQDLLPIVDTLMVKLKTTTNKTVIRYTTDGQDPQETSKLYENPLVFFENSTLKVAPFRNGKRGKVQKAVIQKVGYNKAIELTKPKKGVKRWVLTNNKENIIEIGLPKNNKFTVVSSLEPKDYNAKENYTVFYKGYVKIEKDDIYQLQTHDSKGCTVYLDNKFLLEYNDTWYEKQIIGLKAGYHSFYIKLHGAKKGRRFSVQLKPVNGQPLKLNEILYHE